MDTKPRKRQIVGMEEALSKIPAEDRDELKKNILAAFEKAAGTGELPGKLVIRLPDGTKACPKCGNKLKHPHTFRLPAEKGRAPRSAGDEGTIQYPARAGGAFAGQLITYLECTACEQPYMVRASE